MGLSNTTVKQTYQGDGVTVNFAIPFAVIEDDSVETKVYVRDESVATAITETLQTEGAMQDYTLTGASPPSTPFNTTVTFNTAPTANQKIIVIRQLALTHDLDLDPNQAIDVEALEDKVDRLTAQIQQLQEVVDRVPKLRVSEQFGDTTMGQAFANYLLKVNADNNGFEMASAASVLASIDGGSSLSPLYTGAISDSQSNTAVESWPTLDETVYTSAILFGEIKRGTTGGHVILSIRYINSAWVVQKVLENTDAASGVTFNMSGGDLQYSSGSEGAGTLKFVLLRFAA